MNNIRFFIELLRCNYDVSLQVFDRQGNLLPDPDSIPFSVENDFNIDFSSRQISLGKDAASPFILSGVHHTMWLADETGKEEQDQKVYLIGPFFIDSFPEKQIRSELQAQHLPMKQTEDTIRHLERLPVISFVRIMEYLVMMHYALTGERINIYDLNFILAGEEARPQIRENNSDEDTTLHGTYKIESEMLKMVSEGDLGVLDYIRQLSAKVSVGKLANDDSDYLRQLKNTILVSITLFSRAAIKGGLYPDTAMTLTDRYFQAVEATGTFQEIAEINRTMQSDFVHRVHRIRHAGYLSRPVSDLISYLELHLEDELRLKEIAGRFGYTEYYLTRIFRNQTGKTFKEYLRDLRLERARSLLENSDLPVHEISDRLHFTSHSFFTECFRKKFGVSPKDFRRESLR